MVFRRWNFEDCLNNRRLMKNPYELAHRMRTVENVDQIIVLDGDVVAERGTHAELMS